METSKPSQDWCRQCELSPEWCGLEWQCVELERNGKMPEPATFSEPESDSKELKNG